MPKVLTYDFHEIDNGSGGSEWETHINGVLAGTIHDLDGALHTIDTVVREGHSVHVHRAVRW